MKTKIAIHCASIVALATLMMGCCTQSLLQRTKEVTLNSFSPSAAYQTTNGTDLGLEGISREHFNYQAEYFWHTQPGVHTYLIIPGESLAFQHQQTDGNFFLGEIKKLPHGLTKSLKPKNKLPSDYKKVADLPKNEIYLDVETTRPSTAASTTTAILFMPFTIAFDIVTFPIQLPFLLAMKSGHT